jgi:putative transposase
MHKTVRTFKYRIYPTKRQQTILRQTLDECRWLYNHLLEQRKVAWEARQESIGLYDQHAQLPQIKQARPSLTVAHSQVLQNVAVRLDLAFKAFFRRVKAGETPGYPRFRGRDRYDSFCYPQYGNGCKLTGAKLYLSKVGIVQVVLHRPIEGTPKTCCIRRTSGGKWFVTLACACAVAEPEPTDAQVGLDVGLHTFATLSTGEALENPRFFRKEERALARAQRRMAKEVKGTPARAKRRQVVSRIHERIANKRHDFAHQHSRRIVDRFGLIAVEDINVNRLVHNHCLAKSIADAAWSDFLAKLSYKAAWADRICVAVNPAYTSQTCSRCGHRQPMPLPERVYHCPCCGLELDRDLNASLNILAVGLHSIRNQSAEARPLQGWE